MVARQVHPRFRDQRYQSGYKIQWIEDHVGRSIPIRRLQLIAHPGAYPSMNDLLRMRSFGHLLRSISLNMNDYSPQSIATDDSKSHLLATTLILGQAPTILRQRQALF